MAPAIQIPKFEVDLDEPPVIRWRKVATHFRKELSNATTELEAQLLPNSRIAWFLYLCVVQYCNALAQPLLVSAVAAALIAFGFLSLWWSFPLTAFVVGSLTIPYRREIVGIGRTAGISVGKILLVQYVYEFVSACTSVVVRDATLGHPVHLRVMDWEMPGMDLKKLVCEITFVSQKRPLFIATTWAGLVGVFTGMTLRDSTVTKKTDLSRRSFSVSLNFRTVDYDGRQHLYDSAVDEDGSDDDASTTGHNVQHPQNHSACIQWHSLKGVLLVLRTLAVLLLQCCHATGATLTRRVLESSTSYEDATAKLRKWWLTSPVYFIVAGELSHQGACLARARHGVDQEYALEPPKKGEAPASSYVSQANSDWWLWSETPGDQSPLAQLVMSSDPSELASGEQLLQYASCGGESERWEFLAEFPICNPSSVYACIMCPKTQQYSTRTNLTFQIDD